MNSGLLENAKKNNQDAEGVFLELEGPISGNYAISLHNKGRILMLNKKYKDAYSVLLDSKRIQEKVNGNVISKTEQYIQELEKILKQ